MAHELHMDTRAGRASMMYVGEAPWHGLGTKLDAPATAAEAIEAAGLAWTVAKKPLYVGDTGRRRLRPLDGSFAVVREDKWEGKDCPVFGVVSSLYTPLQNRDAFAFFDPIVGKDAAVYHTAGALGDGERVWILAKLPETIRAIGDDICDKYLLLSNSHDGNSSVQVKFTPIRVVCQNTLTMALRSGPTVRVSHTRNLHVRLREAERLLGIVNTTFVDIEQAFQRMALVRMNVTRLLDYLQAVFPDPNDPSNEKAWQRAKLERAWAEHFFSEGAGNTASPAAGTLWAAYNGVTEYVDHRATATTATRRLESVWFGDGYLRKARAFDVAVARLREWRN